MRRAGADDGFTLVELLVSMALLGMAAVLVAQGFATDRGALRSMDGLTTSGETVAAAQDLIRDRIEHMFAQAQFANTGPHVDFIGSTDAMEFLAPLPIAGKVAQIERLRLALNADGDLTLSPQRQGEGGDGGPSPLLKNVKGLEFTYYGVAPPDGRPGWRSQWAMQSTPPQLVKMHVAFPAGDRRIWPELIVRPAATVDTACILDVATALCRGRQ